MFHPAHLTANEYDEETLWKLPHTAVQLTDAKLPTGAVEAHGRIFFYSANYGDSLNRTIPSTFFAIERFMRRRPHIEFRSTAGFATLPPQCPPNQPLYPPSLVAPDRGCLTGIDAAFRDVWRFQSVIRSLSASGGLIRRQGPVFAVPCPCPELQSIDRRGHVSATSFTQTG